MKWPPLDHTNRRLASRGTLGEHKYRRRGTRASPEPSMPFHKKPDAIRNPEAFLELMRPCREAMTRQMSEVKPFGVFYSGMLTVVAAIDAMATLLGRPEHYWATGSTPRAEQRDQ
jgi:hypothetical protein